MLVKFFVNLKEGYKPVLADKEEKEATFSVEADNMTTAVQMVRQMLKPDNVDGCYWACVGIAKRMNDNISRQKAVDAIRKCIVKEVTPTYMLINKDDAINELMLLPPAQPKIIHCNECLMHGVCRFERGLGINGYCSQAERKEET